MITSTIPAIERQLDFRASPERLWRAITDDGELGAWFGQAAHLDLRAGGGRLVRMGGPRPCPGPHGGRRADHAASRGAGATSASPSTRLHARRVPPRAAGERRNPPPPARVRFAPEASRWSNTEGWLSELAELAQHVAAEPFEAGIRRTYALTSSPRARLARVQRAGGARRLVVGLRGHRDPARLRGLVRLAERGRPVRDADRGGRAAALPVLVWTPAPEVPVAEAAPGPAHRVDAGPARGRRHRPPPVRERLHRAEGLRVATAAAGTATCCRRCASTSARPDRRRAQFTRARPSFSDRPGASAAGRRSALRSAVLDAGARISASEQRFGPVGMRGFDRAWLSGNASRGAVRPR